MKDQNYKIYLIEKGTRWNEKKMSLFIPPSRLFSAGFFLSAVWGSYKITG
jgi:hypothetical protein